MTKSSTLRFTVLMALTLTCTAPVARAASSDAENDFVEVKTSVNALLSDSKRKKFRHNYKALNAKLKKLSKKHQKSPRADDFLFVSAKLYEELYLASRVAVDLDAAIAAYTDVADKFPSANLADDALLKAAELESRRGSDEAARALLERLVAMPKADMRGSAQKRLKELPPSKVVKKTLEKKPNVDDILAELEKESSKAVVTPAQKTIEVLPQAPAAGTPNRRVSVLKHKTIKGESTVVVPVSGLVGITRGEALPDAERGRRIFFDLTPAKLSRKMNKALRIEDGIIKQVRAGQFTKNTVRVVIDLAGDKEPVLMIDKKPFALRFVSEDAPVPVSLAKNEETPTNEKEKPGVKVEAQKDPKVAETVDDKKKDAAASKSEVAKAKADKPLIAELDPKKTDAKTLKKRIGSDGTPGGVSISQQMGLAVKRVVIDAGHGGSDTGAIGPTGVKEKTVTLAIARLVRDRLQQQLPDVEVVMTRDSDKTMELSDRTEIANNSRADLFISIHANAHPSRKVRGIETYYLNITHDRYAMKLAKRENSALAHAGHKNEKSISDLQFILADLAMKSNVDDSIRLGRQVQRSVVNELKQNYKSIHDLGLKHALFYVLMGARMPAILVETSFLSNRVEEKRLRDKKYQRRVADGIVRGVKSFLAERHAFHAANSK